MPGFPRQSQCRIRPHRHVTMRHDRRTSPAPSIQEKLAIYENGIQTIVSRSALIASGSVGLVPVGALGADEMVQGGEGAAGALIAPRRLPNPCLDSPQRMDLHRELLFNQKIGKNVLNQKSELQKALSRHKEKQILNQVKEHKETPELERAIASRARRLEAASPAPESDPATNATLQELRARLRHAADSPAVQ